MSSTSFFVDAVLFDMVCTLPVILPVATDVEDSC